MTVKKKRALPKQNQAKKPLKLKKTLLKKTARKKFSHKKTKTAPKTSAAKKNKTNVILGKITHYFPHVKAGIVKLKSAIKIGDTVRIKGHTTNFTETISSMQINHVSVTQAQKGQEIGLLVASRVRRGDTVYKLQQS